MSKIINKYLFSCDAAFDSIEIEIKANTIIIITIDFDTAYGQRTWTVCISIPPKTERKVSVIIIIMIPINMSSICAWACVWRQRSPTMRVYKIINCSVISYNKRTYGRLQVRSIILSPYNVFLSIPSYLSSFFSILPREQSAIYVRAYALYSLCCVGISFSSE